MIAAGAISKASGRTHFPNITALRPVLQQLRESFAEDFRRTPKARLSHALQIRSGISSDEPFSEWQPRLEDACGMKPLGHGNTNFPRINSRFAPLHCPLGQIDEVTGELIHAAHEIFSSDPLYQGFRTDNFLLVLFVVALARPQDVSYRIHQASFRPNGTPLSHRPFKCLEDFEKWENGEEDLPEGRYFLWLNRDVRICAVSVIDALLVGRRSAGAPQSDRVERLAVDTTRLVAIVDGEEHHVEPDQAQILNALVEAKESGEWWVTGPEMLQLPACGGKISRVIERLEKDIPQLRELIIHGSNKGYRLRE